MADLQAMEIPADDIATLESGLAAIAAPTASAIGELIRGAYRMGYAAGVAARGPTDLPGAPLGEEASGPPDQPAERPALDEAAAALAGGIFRLINADYLGTGRRPLLGREAVGKVVAALRGASDDGTWPAHTVVPTDAAFVENIARRAGYNHAGPAAQRIVRLVIAAIVYPDLSGPELRSAAG